MMSVLRSAGPARILAHRVQRAQTWWDRCVGLIPRAEIDTDEGMWFSDCSAIHTFFMRAKIDVLFLDEHGRIIEMRAGVPPNRPAVTCSAAKHVVELGAGAIEKQRIRLGERIRLE